jgi:GAF domain-containing protein
VTDDLVKMCKRLSKYAHAQLSSTDLDRIANRIEGLESDMAALADMLRKSKERNDALEANLSLALAGLDAALSDFYAAANRFQDEDYEGPVDGLTVSAVCHAKPHYDIHMQHLDDSAAKVRNILAKLKGHRDEN